eukprot:EG_transcript_32065
MQLQLPNASRSISTSRFLKNSTKGVESGNPKTWEWWWDKFIVCLVFAIAGSSIMFLVRPFIKNVLKIEGSLKEGPNSFRILYVMLVPPIYSSVLVVTGVIFGRKAYFVPVALRIWGRVLPKSLMDKLK